MEPGHVFRDLETEELQLQGPLGVIGEPHLPSIEPMIVRLFNLVEVEVDEELLQLGEIVGDKVKGGGGDSTEHVWHSCQLESRDPDQPA